MAPPELATGPGHPDCHSENSPSLPGVTQSHLGHLERMLPLAHRLALFFDPEHVGNDGSGSPHLLKDDRR